MQHACLDVLYGSVAVHAAQRARDTRPERATHWWVGGQKESILRACDAALTVLGTPQLSVRTRRPMVSLSHSCMRAL